MHQTETERVTPAGQVHGFSHHKTIKSPNNKINQALLAVLVTTKKIFKASRKVYYTSMIMSWTFVFLMAGFLFNVRMLRSCFKDKEKNTFLQNCKTLTVFQCVCQVTILVVDAVGSWKELETQSREPCNVFRVLSSSTLFFQGCNIMAILIVYFDHPTAHGASELCSKLKVSAALCLGFTGSLLIWWYNCYLQEFYSHFLALIIIVMVMLMMTAAFVFLMFAADAWNNNQVKLEDTTAEASMNTFSLLCKVFIENKKLAFFITLLLMCLVILSCSSTEVIKDVTYSFISKFVLGIVLPVTFSDLIDSSYESEKEIQKMVVI